MFRWCFFTVFSCLLCFFSMSWCHGCLKSSRKIVGKTSKSSNFGGNVFLLAKIHSFFFCLTKHVTTPQNTSRISTTKHVTTKKREVAPSRRRHARPGAPWLRSHRDWDCRALGALVAGRTVQLRTGHSTECLPLPCLLVSSHLKCLPVPPRLMCLRIEGWHVRMFLCSFFNRKKGDLHRFVHFFRYFGCFFSCVLFFFFQDV